MVNNLKNYTRPLNNPRKLQRPVNNPNESLVARELSPIKKLPHYRL